MASPDPGPVVLQSDVEAAVAATLKAWVPFYLADIDEQQGRARGTTKEPRFWDLASDNDSRWLDETAPTGIVACPTTVDDPELHGEAASYAATWQVNIGVTAGGATERGTRALAGRYAGAILYVLAQQGDMGGLAERTRWRGTRTDLIGRQRAVSGCEVLAHVHIARVVDTRGLLPRDLPADPIDPAAPTITPSGTRILTIRRP